MSLRRTITAAAVLIASLEAAKAGAATLPPGFQETIVFSGLTRPTAVRFSPDGRIFVAEKAGLIKVFDSLASSTPAVFADLRTEVDDYWDRGLLGLALHPGFPATPYVYVLYSYDAPIGGSAPTWGDTCPNPPGPTTNGCVVSGRLSRLTAAGNVMTGPEEVLLEAWGQQFPSHSIGDLRFGPDGALYVSGGEGASFNNVDYGQYGDPKNPLGDPPVPAGEVQTPPAAEGGALRSQSLRRAGGGPALANGAILRVDAGGAPLPDNPLYGSSDEIARRIVAHGLRNPFRFTVQPGTGSLWIGDVGWSQWEEINRIPNPTDGTVRNFGWPCYEGAGQQTGYAAANLAICANLFATPGAVTGPVYTYKHNQKVVAGETCTTGSSAISGLAFYETGNYPETYRGALFFADYSRRCAWVMFPNVPGGPPNPANRATFIAGAATPVDLQIGPEGDLFYADYGGGSVRRVQHFAPTAVAAADPIAGAAPLSVAFDASSSRPAREEDTITFAWDLDGDGDEDDSTEAQPTFVYTEPGNYAVRLRVTDNHGVSAVADPLTISVNEEAPLATVDSPAPTLTWKVGDTIVFSGHATDVEDGPLPDSALTWTALLRHCPSNCHTHTLETFEGVAGGSIVAPDHEFPSYLDLQLTATDSQGLTSTRSVALHPRTVNLTFQSSPPGILLAAGTGSGTTPFGRTVIVGSMLSIAAPATQTLGGTPYGFASWSDGGAASHTVVAGSSPVTYSATYTAADLSLSEAASPPAAICPGGPVAWTLSARNAGPTAAASVAVAVTLPDGVALEDVSGDGWSCSGSPAVVCTRSVLDRGDAPPITVTFAAPAATGPTSFSAAVSAATIDPIGGNNTVFHYAASDPLACPPQVSQVTPSSGLPWSSISIAIEGENFKGGATVLFGAVAGSGVTVVDPSRIDVTAPPLPPATLHDVAVRNVDGLSGALARAYFSDFSDVPQAHPYHGGVEKLFRSGITSGCGGGNFCPDLPITRAAMAIFLLRGIHGASWTPPPATGTLFSDVKVGDFAAAWIEELARAGISSGCGGGNFCPAQTVDRASQAVLLLRSKYHGSPYSPPPPTGFFDDVPVESPFAPWIEQLFREGITSGCGGPNYCPDGLNTRGEMAVFLSRTFNLP